MIAKYALKFGMLSVALALGPAVRAQESVGAEKWPPPGVSYYGDRGAPDISGLWLGQAFGIPGEGPKTNTNRSTDGRPPTYWNPWPLPYKPEYQRIYEERREATKRGVAQGDIGARCLPFGMPWQVAMKVYPDEIVQTPGAVSIFMYAYGVLVIWTDGRQHPKNLEPSYSGHSIGNWVGDTLYVDTVGIRANTPLDSARNPHSGKLRMKWSIMRVAPDKLHLDIKLFDDEAFTEPVALTNIWARLSERKWEVLDDQSCFGRSPPPSSAPAAR